MGLQRSSIEIKNEIEKTLGFFPPFFEPALKSPAILENLWQQTVSAYVENPIPALFKEKLAAYLARFCTVPYCLLCHSSSLRPLGMKSSDVLTLLQEEPLGYAELAEKTKGLEDKKFTQWPEAGSKEEEGILHCCIAIFLNQDAEEYQEKLRASLTPDFYDYLNLFLIYNRTCLSWAEAHPELNYKSDHRVQRYYADLVGDDPKLAKFFDNYKERAEQQSLRRSRWLSKESEQIADNEEKLKLALEAGRIGFYDWNLVTNKVIYSDKMKIDWGFSSNQEVNLEEIFKRFHPEDSQRVQDLMKDAIENHKPYFADYRIVRPDGTTTWVEVRGRITYDENNKPRHFYGTGLNVTDVRNAAEELQSAKIIAEQANQTKSAFLANMSHEIRTPLGAILGFADLLKDARLTSEEREYLNVITRNGQALSHVIDDILDLSKVEAGKLAIENVPFEIGPLVKEVVTMFSDQARSKEITLRFEAVGAADKYISSDPTRIRQILVNLIGNAIKFTSYGSVGILLKFQEQPGSKANIEIHIADTGTGMSAEQAEKLFKPFQQADESTARKFGGTGLGLALSKRLANALGGDVIIEKTAPGKGSTFLFQFSATEEAHEDDMTTEITSVRVGGKKPLRDHSILVVDDSPDNRVLINLLLKREGAIVDEALGGREAVKKALANNYDVILMDIQMPGMDGYESLANLMKAGYAKPVIALTAHAMAEEKRRTLAAGFADHVTKPIDPAFLVEAILKHVPEKN